MVRIRTATLSSDRRVVTPLSVPDQAYLEQFQKRLLLDAMLEATADYWMRRAGQIEQALFREGDFPGQTTPEQRAEHNARIRVLSLNCRRKAELVRRGHL